MFKIVVKKFLRFFFYHLARSGIVETNGRPIINGFCQFKAKLILGGNVNFNGAKTYGAGTVSIGDNFHSGAGLIVLTQNHNYQGDSIPYDKTVVIKDVVIGDNVWVGVNVLILPGVKIGEGAIIQAGSVVSKSVPDLAIAGGNPAQVIRFRDKDHYFLKKKNACYF